MKKIKLQSSRIVLGEENALTIDLVSASVKFSTDQPQRGSSLYEITSALYWLLVV